MRTRPHAIGGDIATLEAGAIADAANFSPLSGGVGGCPTTGTVILWRS